MATGKPQSTNRHSTTAMEDQGGGVNISTSIESEPEAANSAGSNSRLREDERITHRSSDTIKTTPHEDTAQKYKLAKRKAERGKESPYWQLFHIYESERPGRHLADTEYANCNYCGYDVNYKRPGETPSTKPLRVHIHRRHRQVAKLVKATQVGNRNKLEATGTNIESSIAQSTSSPQQRRNDEAKNSGSAIVASTGNASASTGDSVPPKSTRRDRQARSGRQHTRTAPTTTSFEVFVSKDTFKFNAAHFVAFHGFRERLHGHNYRVSVRLLGSRTLGPDGYLMDFGNIKAVTKKVCKDLNEHFLCPMLSDVIQITDQDETASIQLKCEDGAIFVIPKSDCAMLPIMHATAEELAIYLWGKILNGLSADYLQYRGIHSMEVVVAEAIGQEATFRHEIGSTNFFEVSSFVKKGEIIPMPCLGESSQPPPRCCPNCDKKATLERLANAINKWELDPNNVTASDLEKLWDNNH